jgi:hypothetical protein
MRCVFIKSGLPLLLFVALLISSTAGCTVPVSVEPGHPTVGNAPTGAGTDFDVSISARKVQSMTCASGVLCHNASPGHKLVGIECSLKDRNVANLFTCWREWTAIDENGTLYVFHYNVDLIHNGYPETTIQPGDTARGIIPYEIPVNAKIVKMRYIDETTNSHTLACNVTR